MQSETIEGFSLSPQQRHICSLQRTTRNQPYLTQCLLLIEGPLNPHTLYRVLEDVVSRHEILRTSFHHMPGMKMPLQFIAVAHPFSIPVYDFSALEPQEQELKMEALVLEARTYPFDVEHGPLCHFSLAALAPCKHFLLITASALCADASTLKNIVLEISRSYADQENDEAYSHEPMQYADLSEWQNELLQEESAEAQLTYWHRLDRSQLMAMHLPFSPILQGTQSMQQDAAFTPCTINVPLEADLYAQITALAQQYDSSLAAFLLTCWQILLHRFTNTSDLVIGATCDGRRYQDLVAALGPYTRVVPLCTSLTEGWSFKQALTQTDSLLEEAIERQEYFVWERSDEQEEPFLPLSFELIDWPGCSSGDELRFSIQRCYSCYERFALKLEALRTETTLSLALHYDPLYFSTKQIKYLGECLRSLLRGAVTQPMASVDTLKLLDAKEQQRLLQLYAQTRVTNSFQPLQRLFDIQVQDHPDTLALVCGNAQLTYQGLHSRANQLAHLLRLHGVGPNVPVAICLPRCPDFLLAVLAVLAAGGAYAPLDPTHPPTRLDLQLSDLAPAVLLTHQSLRSRFPTWHGSVLCLDAPPVLLATQPTTTPPVSLAPTDLAYLIYTSGSTGLPKAVMISQQAISAYTASLLSQFAFAPGWHRACVSSLAADLGNTTIFGALASGGCLHLLEEDVLTSATAWQAYARRWPLDVLKIVPSHLAALLAQLPAPSDLLPERILFLGGERLPLSLLERLEQEQNGCTVVNHYGPTESTIGVLTHDLGEAREAARRHGQGPVPLGRPLAHVQFYVLDARQHLLPVGVVGELYVGGIALAHGYLGRGAQTAERFVPDPFGGHGGQRLYRTGDLGRWREDGALEFVGRLDSQVKVRGYRIELGEIESTLAQHPAVRECVVLAQDDNQENKRLVAYVVAAQMGEQEALTSVELRSYLQTRLPEYMLPSFFVVLPALPLTSNGKIDRRALPAPETLDAAADHQEIDARTPLEELVQEFFCEVLGREHIGIHDNFFELGGHSLLATQLISRLQTVMQIELPLRSVFEAPTAAGLAEQAMQVLRRGQGVELPPIQPISRAQDLPLSFAQQRLWFLDQLEPGSAAYNIPKVVRLHGPLYTAALSEALKEVVRRHESLRTTFQMKTDQPVQIIADVKVFSFPFIDLTALPLEQREVEGRRIARQEALQPFDMARGPLLRTQAVRLSQNEHILLVTMHHIVTDGWSMNVFVREITTLYNAFTLDHPSPLPELPIQYADFAAWQRQWLQGEALETQLSYWTRQLNAITPLELPTDHPRPALQTFRGAHQTRLLPSSLSSELRALSQHEDVTLFMTLLAAFQLLLARYSGQQDIAVGTPIANRTRREVEGLIGFFVNTLVLRTDLSGTPSFQGLLRRVREVCLGAYAHQDVPFEKIVEVLQPERDLSRSPLFQVMFILQNAHRPSKGFGEMTLNSLESSSDTAKFDLTLFIADEERGLRCVLEYNTDLFEPDTITRMLEHWQTLLEGIVTYPQHALASLPLLSTWERDFLLYEHNAFVYSLPTRSFLPLFAAQVAASPDRIALSFQDACLSYEQVYLLAWHLSLSLLDAGAQPDQPIAVLADRSLLFVLAILACWFAGCAYLPLDPLYPPLRLRSILQQSHPPFVLASHAFQSLIETLLAPMDESAGELHMPVMYLEALLAGQSPASRLPDAQDVGPVHPCQLAYILYTSGSTGSPKGVMVQQEGMLNHLLAKIADVGMTAEDIMAHTSPQGFDISLWQAVAPLLVGARSDILPDASAFDPALLLAAVEERSISVLQLVPALLRGLLTEVIAAEPAPKLSSLRWLVPTGDALPTEVCHLWWQYYPSIPLLNTYGSTECSDDQCHYAMTSLSARDGALPITPIGFPIHNLRRYVLDESGELVPLGLIGELYLGGLGVGRGYLDDPERTAQTFLPDPFSSTEGGRLYKTNDLVRILPDGNLEFLGRRDQLIKVRGHRIEPGEIESHLRQHPLVEEVVVLSCAVLGIPEEQLVAYLVCVPGAEADVSSQEWRRYLEGRLPVYMIPAYFVRMEELPLNANGKVDRHALPAVRPQAESRSEGSMIAHGPIEEIVTTIWKEVLRREQVDLHDNFFAQGGHSLLATQVVARLRMVLRIEMPLRSLFEAPTIAGLSALVERTLHEQQGLQIPPLVPVPRDPRTQVPPLSFAQQRLWFLDRLQPGNAAYNLPIAVRLHGKLDLVALRRSLHEIVRRHESLRTTFHTIDGLPAQVIATPTQTRLPLTDLSALLPAEREAEAQRLVRQEAQRPFNLAHGLLLRAHLLQLGADEYALLFTMHHIISDGWSMGVFVRELSSLYRAFVAGQPSPLPELPIQYADFAFWQRQWLQGKVLATQLDYWTRHLNGITPLELPADHARPAVQSYRGASYSFRLSASLSHALMALSRQEGATLFMTLLTAFQTLLYRYTGQTDIAVGTDSANRTRLETENLIGFFVNLLVLRTSLSGAPSFREGLHRVHEMLLGAYTHQETPFEMLVERLQPNRAIDRMPLVQVLFVLQNVPPARAQELPGMKMSTFGKEIVTSKFDIALFMQEGPTGLSGNITYSTDLFDPATIATMAGRFAALLQSAVDHPDDSIDVLDMQTEAEKVQHKQEEQKRRQELKISKGERIELPPREM